MYVLSEDDSIHSRIIYNAFIWHNQLDIAYTVQFKQQYALLAFKNHDMKTFNLAVYFPP